MPWDVMVRCHQEVVYVPKPTECWSCGRPGEPIPGSGFRRACTECDVTWSAEATPRPPRREDLEGLQLLLSAKWPLRRHAEYADNYDRLVDHGAVKLSSPA